MPQEKFAFYKNLLNESDLRRKDRDIKDLVRFWEEFYERVQSQATKEQGKGSKSNQYKVHTFDILHEAKSRFLAALFRHPRSKTAPAPLPPYRSPPRGFVRLRTPRGRAGFPATVAYLTRHFEG